jgi:hypothetical protein
VTRDKEQGQGLDQEQRAHRCEGVNDPYQGIADVVRIVSTAIFGATMLP